MPYAKGHYWVAFVLLVTIVGFWPSYFLKISNVPLGFHVHAFTALVWTSLVLVQSWTIHNRKNHLHKQLGKLSLLLFPFLMVGFVMIVNISAQRYITAESDFAGVTTPSFGLSMLVAIAAYLTVYYLALKNRRNTALHAGYMLTTPLILFESPFSRIMTELMPWTVFTNSEGPQFVLDAIVIAMVGSAIFALVIYFRARDKAFPFLVAAIFLIIESLAMGFGTHLTVWRDIFAVYGSIPEVYTILAVFVIGAVVTWRGWVDGSPGGGFRVSPATA